MTAQAVQTEERYWSVLQLADHFGVSKSTIYRAYKDWPHSEIGGIKFSSDDVAKIEVLIHRDAGDPAEPEPKYSAKKLAKAAQRLGLPAPRRGS